MESNHIQSMFSVHHQGPKLPNEGPDNTRKLSLEPGPLRRETVGLQLPLQDSAKVQLSAWASGQVWEALPPQSWVSFTLSSFCPHLCPPSALPSSHHPLMQLEKGKGFQIIPNGEVRRPLDEQLFYRKGPYCGCPHTRLSDG